MPSTAEEVLALKLWAADNKCIFEDEGEVGFGRECVGITDGNQYVDLPEHPYVPMDEEITEADRKARDDHYAASPPEGVEHAYHKYPCLAVLGRGPEAVHELYLWVEHLKAGGFTVRHEAREPASVFDVILKGTTRVVLTR